MVLFALRTRSSVAPLGLSVAALWLTNSPAAVMGSYLLAILALGMWIAERRPWPALRATGGMALGLGLAAFYIVPAAYEQRWVQIGRAITPGMRVQDSFLFAHTTNDFHNQVLRAASWIFVAEIIVGAIAAYLAWRKRADGYARGVLTGILPVLLLLQLPVSDAIWKYTPHLKFLQFPWRWVLPLSVVTCVLAAMALSGSLVRGLRTRLLGFAGMMVLAIGGGWLFFQPCDDEDAVGAQVAAFQQGQGTQGTDEYTPVGADNASVQQDLPLVRVLRTAKDDAAESSKGDNPEWRAGDPGTIAAKVAAKPRNAEHWMVKLSTPENGYAVLRLMDYPSWQVAVDGRDIISRPSRKDGLLTVPVTAGSHAIEVQWGATRDIVVGRVLTVFAVLGLVGTVVLERRVGRV